MLTDTLNGGEYTVVDGQVTLVIDGRWGAILITPVGTDLTPPDAPTDLTSEAGNGFYRQAAPYLQVGASSQSLAKQLNLPVDQVRYELAQMRALAMILPVQAYREEQAAPKPKGLIARLTGALFRRQREL